MQLFSADATIFLPSKVAHNPTRLTVFSPTIFCFVKLRQFYSLKFSHLWSSQTLQDESLEFLWCGYNSIPPYSTQLPILRHTRKAWNIYFVKGSSKIHILSSLISGRFRKEENIECAGIQISNIPPRRSIVSICTKS